MNLPSGTLSHNNLRQNKTLMFLLNGDPIKVHELVKQFSVPVPDKSARRVERVFTIAETSKRKDYLNNRIAHPNKIQAPTEFVGVDDEGFEVNLRYFNRKRPTKRGGVETIEYQPTHIGLDGETKVVDTRRQLEEYVYMYLHPWCKNSPLRRGGRFKYELIDEIANAKSNNLQSKDLLWCLDAIHNGDIETLRQRATGLKIAHVASLEDEEVRNRLETIAFKDPTSFRYSWEDAGVLYRGVINTAIQRGIVEEKELQGTRYWQWSSENGGERICPIPRNARDTSSTLLQYAAENFGTTMKAIEAAVNGSNVEDKLRSKSSAAVSADNSVVIKAFELGVIMPDFGENSVYLMKSGGREAKIFEFEEPAGWIDKLTEHLDSDDGKDVLKKINAKMRAISMHQKRKAKQS